MEKMIVIPSTVDRIAEAAVQSLIEEAELSPKPGLVDRLDSGSHDDLTIRMMKDSAYSLKDTFMNIAKASYGRYPSQELREEIAVIGRKGEKRMFEVTEGVNTHKGAIWALGLIVSAISIGKGSYKPEKILSTAGEIARYPDRNYRVTSMMTNGERVKRKYGVHGAKEQAEEGFPHVLHYSYPTLMRARNAGKTEKEARLYSLLSLIAHLDDTCILHRGGKEGLQYAQREAKKILNMQHIGMLGELNETFIKKNISP